MPPLTADGPMIAFALSIAGAIVLAYLLGREVGKDHGRR